MIHRTGAPHLKFHLLWLCLILTACQSTAEIALEKPQKSKINQQGLDSNNAPGDWHLLDSQPAPRRPLPQPSNPQLINVDAVDRDLQELCKEIGQKVGREILVSPGIEETVTITLREIPWTDAIKIIAKLTKCDLEAGPENGLLLTQICCVTIEFEDASLRTVLMLLSAYMGMDIKFSAKFRDRNISLTPPRNSGRDAILEICQSNGLIPYIDSKRETLFIQVKID